MFIIFLFIDLVIFSFNFIVSYSLNGSIDFTGCSLKKKPDMLSFVTLQTIHIHSKRWENKKKTNFEFSKMFAVKKATPPKKQRRNRVFNWSRCRGIDISARDGNQRSRLALWLSAQARNCRSNGKQHFGSSSSGTREISSSAPVPLHLHTPFLGLARVRTHAKA